MTRVVLGVLLAAALCGCGRGGAGALKQEYKMQVTVGPANHWGLGAAKFAELAKAKTNGKINIKPYYGSQLLKGAQLSSAQMVSSGAIDCALESTINLCPAFPELNVFSLPFFVDGHAQLDKLEAGATGRLLFTLLERKGLQPLAWGENGFRQLTNSKRPVKTPDDLKGLKIRVVGSPIFVDIYRALGADPINMNWGDAVVAFQQGAVDGQENPMGILISTQISKYHKYLTLWNYLADPLVLCWNKAEWDAFPGDIKQALTVAAVEACAYEKALARANLDGSVLKKEGMEMTIPDAPALAAFKKATAPVIDAWSAKIGPEVMAAAKADMR